jgi:hypothetical protein
LRKDENLAGSVGALPIGPIFTVAHAAVGSKQGATRRTVGDHGEVAEVLAQDQVPGVGIRMGFGATHPGHVKPAIIRGWLGRLASPDHGTPPLRLSILAWHIWQLKYQIEGKNADLLGFVVSCCVGVTCGFLFFKPLGFSSLATDLSLQLFQSGNLKVGGFYLFV